MRVAAEKAIQLDPLLAEAHDALGIAFARDGEWLRSEKSFRRAIELDVDRPMTHTDFAIYLLWPLGRIKEALRQLSLAENADALVPIISKSLRGGDIVLVKGSNSARMSRVVKALTEWN